MRVNDNATAPTATQDARRQAIESAHTATPVAAAPKPVAKPPVDAFVFGKSSVFDQKYGLGVLLQPPNAQQANTQQASVAQAQADYSKIRQEPNSLGEQHMLCDALKAHPDDTAYQVELIRAAKADTQLGLLTTRGIMSPGGGVFGRDPYAGGAYRSDFSDQDRAAFTSAMSAARQAGVVTDAEIQAAAKDDSVGQPSAWQELANRIGTPGVHQSPLVIQSSATEVKGAQDSYDSAKAAKEKADEELSGQMSHFDQTLTPDQKQKYIEKYRADHKAVYDSYDAASTRLADSLRRNGPALETAAAARPPDKTAAEALAKGYQALATSPCARDAMDFVVRVGKDPALAEAFKGRDLVKDIFQPAAATVTGLALADPSKTPAQALDELKATYDGYAKQLEGVKDLKEFGKSLKEGIGQIRTGLDELKKLRAGQYKPAELSQAIADNVKKWNEKSPFGKVLAVTGAMYGYKAVYDAAQDGDKLKAVSAFASSISGTNDVAAMALGAWARSGRIFAKQAANAGEFMTKFAPFLGAVASGTGAAVDIREAMNGGNAGDWINVAGDLLSFAGSVGTCFPEVPPAYVAGAILIGAGTILSAVGSLASGLINRGATEDEQRKCLQNAGITDSKVIDAFIHCNNSAINDLVEKLGFQPQDAQAFLRAHGEFAKFLGAGNLGTNFIAAAQAMGVHDMASMQSFLGKLTRNNRDEISALYWLTDVRQANRAQTDDQYRTMIKQLLG